MVSLATALACHFVLLLAGLIVGPFMQWLKPDEILGNLLFPLVSLAVAVILFEGSLTLNFKEIRGVSGSVWSIVSIGAIISWAATSVATHYFLGFTWELAMLFGKQPSSRGRQLSCRCFGR